MSIHVAGILGLVVIFALGGFVLGYFFAGRIVEGWRAAVGR